MKGYVYFFNSNKIILKKKCFLSKVNTYKKERENVLSEHKSMLSATFSGNDVMVSGFRKSNEFKIQDKFFLFFFLD